MADNIANIPSSIADSTPQETLGAAYTAASGTLRFTGAAKPTYWPSTPYRVTVFDATNGDITFRISVDTSWPNVTAAVVEGADHNLASGASAEHLGPLTVGGFDDRVGATAQPLNADLTALAALNSGTSIAIASDGAGWLGKTVAQFKTWLELVKGDVGLGNVDNTSDANKPVSTAQAAADALKVAKAGDTMTGVLLMPNGSASSPALAIRASNNGVYSPATSQLALACGGSAALTLTTTSVATPSTRLLVAGGGLSVSRSLAYTATTPVGDVPANGNPLLAPEVNIGDSLFNVDDDTSWSNTPSIRAFKIDSEWVIGLYSATTTVTNLIRGAFGTTEAYHAGSTTVYDYDPTTLYNNWCINALSSVVTDFTIALTGNINVYLPPTVTIGPYTATTTRQLYTLSFKDLNGKNVTIYEYGNATALYTLTGAASPDPRAITFMVNPTTLTYAAISKF